MKRLLLSLLCIVCGVFASAQVYSQIDESGEITQVDESVNRNFNKHNKDTTSTNQDVPKGVYVWTVDRKFGDIRPAEVDTMQYMFFNTIFNTGLYGEYNTTGNNYTARESRIVIDRPLLQQFMFTQPYSYVMTLPDEMHFTNTLSPITNISYDNCGNKTNGEDHIDAKFAVNADKKTGFGFDLNYAYARGYYSSQSTSHFGATLYASHIGDQYTAHAIFSTYHQKVSENGGITDDNYITHPETFEDSYSEDEIPTVLSSNWNRNDNLHFFFTHRYSLGFYRMEKMTEAELKARAFAEQSRRENEENRRRIDGEGIDGGRQSSETSEAAPTGRPDWAVIVGDEPEATGEAADTLAKDTLQISPAEQLRMDSIMEAKRVQDSIAATMKQVFVPVTSFIHTLDMGKYDRIYQAYDSPEDYYADTYYTHNDDMGYGGDSIYDDTKLLTIKNTLAIALLEGFNKYAKAGLKVFGSHELRRFDMPDVFSSGGYTLSRLARWMEHNVSVGGQVVKTQGKTFHYNLLAEAWLAGEDVGQLKFDFSTDLNFRLFGDTLTLAAKAYFYRLNPTFYQRHYHSKHIWWDNDDMSKETRTRVEGIFSYRKTRTQLRVALEEIQNYTYFGVSYDTSSDGVTNFSAGVQQAGGNINLFTAQLRQDFKLGILHWENIITYQNSSNENVLPVPALNIFTNLYIKFRYARELSIEIGGDGYFFTRYFAPHFVPQLNQFAVQENSASRTSIGGYPFLDVYANFHLKRTRFFVMMSHVNAGNGNRMYFLTPHYPQNGRIFRFGLSWNFFN